MYYYLLFIIIIIRYTSRQRNIVPSMCDPMFKPKRNNIRETHGYILYNNFKGFLGKTKKYLYISDLR